MSEPPDQKPFAEVNGWRLFLHDSFRGDYERLRDEVAQLKAADPEGYVSHAKAKLFKRITDIISIEVPADPNAAAYQLGNTMGSTHRHWRRAKFLQRFRLFYRFDSRTKMIIYVWVNDENTLRKAGSKTDPYAVFKGRLGKGDPPTDWDDLMKGISYPQTPRTEPQPG
ncbi:type II toxin-antitoxin system YhaV family toxin [Brevundimonas sp. UBA5936]|jgi:toxin YhaV|uniref:type II toxin-antitoxin system YhaV family toxin n=1 Tax=Brevundimonas sp. UBA5936 TaxID=1946133 RepID=UPI0025C6DB55|nr:type II toxin-antitoxin system YhaV family toxin [Brevundimonas sp. UBA5936]